MYTGGLGDWGTGGLGVGSSNLPAPTNKINGLTDYNSAQNFLFGFPWGSRATRLKPDIGAISIERYFTEMLDPSMNWEDLAEMVQFWNGQFCLKGVMSVDDARRAAEIGCTGIVLSNHGGRQLDGSRAAFDQLAEVVDSVGDRIDVMMDGGVQRGTHVLKALSLGAKAVGVGRYYLYPLAAAGQAGVERALGLLRAEIERGMKLMGCASLGQLSRKNLRFR